jgi:cell division transport system permease protein
MTNNKAKYYLSEAFKSIKKLATVASITTAVATMFMLGIFLVLSLNITNVAEDFSRDCQVHVFISDECDENAYMQIGEKIKQIANVSDVEKYTKDQIFQEVKERLGEKASMLDGLENDNPYRNSFKVSLDDLSQLKSVTQSISKIKGVEVVSDLQSAADTIVKVVNYVKNISLWICIILCVIASFIVSNSIKVSVFSRRKEINIMKYIGATDAFIRWPFIFEGILIGLIGAVISFIIIFLAYSQLYTKINISFITLLPFGEIAFTIFAMFVVVGCFIGVSGSIISLRKHLRV